MGICLASKEGRKAISFLIFLDCLHTLHQFRAGENKGYGKKKKNRLLTERIYAVLSLLGV